MRKEGRQKEVENRESKGKRSRENNEERKRKDPERKATIRPKRKITNEQSDTQRNKREGECGKQLVNGLSGQLKPAE